MIIFLTFTESCNPVNPVIYRSLSLHKTGEKGTQAGMDSCSPPRRPPRHEPQMTGEDFEVKRHSEVRDDDGDDEPDQHDQADEFEQ